MATSFHFLACIKFSAAAKRDESASTKYANFISAPENLVIVLSERRLVQLAGSLLLEKSGKLKPLNRSVIHTNTHV